MTSVQSYAGTTQEENGLTQGLAVDSFLMYSRAPLEVLVLKKI